MKKNVLLVCGGRSDEHEISLISAKCVLDAIDRTRFNPLLVGITREGVWHLEDEKNFYTGAFRADQIKLNTEAPTVTIAPYPTPERRGRLQAGGKSFEFDVAFPILHGPFGEDGTIQGLFETMGVPYVGANPGGSWISMDKVLSKMLCRFNGIKVADFVAVASIEELELKKSEIDKMGYPLFVKPSRLGSSVGISKVISASHLIEAVETALKFDRVCLIEQGIKGREIETALLGLNRKARVALPGEIVPNPKIGWYSYDAKYLLDDGAQVVVPARLEPNDITRIQQFVLKVFQVLQIDGMARIDLFLENETGELYLNEANTIPGFTPISMYPKMWQASGLSYQELISELIELAFQRT
jgi:D-alanine-D-alanine ligase